MIEIKTEKIVVRGEQRRRIISFSALTEKELPCEYMNGYPRVSLYMTTLTVRTNTGVAVLIQNDIKEEKDFVILMDIIRKAGDRLRDINKKLEEENKDWHGEETFLI